MASALEEREEQSSKCFICNVKVTTRSSFNVYCTIMPQREVLLMDVMSKILKKVFNPSQMRSSVLCRRCFTLFDELDQISTRFKKLQTDIIKRYLSTCIEYKDDTFLSVVNTICPTKIHDLPLSKQISENTFLSNEDENGEKSSNNALNEIVDTIINSIQAEETMDNVDTIVTNIEAEETMDNVNTIVTNIETEETIDNDTIVNNIEDEETVDNVDTIVSDIEAEETVDNIDTIVSNIEAEETMDNVGNIEDGETVDNVDTIISNIEVEETMDSEDTIISNIKVEETIDNDTDCVKSTADSYIETNVSINKEIMKHIDDTKKNQQVILLPKNVEETTCKTKLRKRSVGISYKCEQCDDSFRRALDLKNHHAMVHQTLKRFFCSSCNKSYSTKQSLNNHLVKEHTSLGKQITDEADSNSFKIDNDISQCGRDCNLEVSAEYANDSSEDVVIDVKPDFNIDNSMYLEEVVEEENEDDDFEWKEEEKFDYNDENIVEDSSSALDETVTPSSGSERSGKRQIKKGRKKKGYSRSGERACLPAIHSCGLCGKKWRTVTELKSHIQSHSSIRPYVCEICGQAYKMKKALDVHIGMHNGIHPFTCEYCHKSFTQKVGLQKHIPIHTGYTRFQCDLCGKRFIHQKSFHIHTMTHTGEKHVKCTECGLAVLSQSHLKRHLRVHTGERPYACPICGKRFAEKYNMNAHVHIHDNNAGNGPRRNRNHICQLCGMSYDRKHKLEYHLASTHNKIDSKLPQDQESVQHHQTKNEYFQENSQGHQIITVNNSVIEPCGISYEHKLKLEYHIASPHNKIESKPSQNQKTEQQSQNEYFQEGHQIITVENRAIENNGKTAMITVSGVKVPLSLDGAPIMVTELPQESQTTDIVPLNIPAGSILTYTPTSSNDNDQPMVDSTQNTYMPQNPVTIQL